MMNKKIYNQGRRKEYKICEQLKKEGFDIIQRTAGSHSPVDIVAIAIKEKRILLIQSKRTLNKDMMFIDSSLKNKIEEKNKELNGDYNVLFEVR